ncbi:hypothetical protein ONZ45_g4649 [Pleurotus djamor]|nr:hypothetical protein ONZ45_g4649 [Pleurotus djamor]
MAQAATMGPPLSPREPRRSGRRSVPSASASSSKSPDSDIPLPPPRAKETPSHRPTLSTSNIGKGKRSKTEDFEDAAEDTKSGVSPVNGSSTPHPVGTNGRNKRKSKEKDKQASAPDTPSEATPARKVVKPVVDDAPVERPEEEEEEEQGITRCVCGSTEDDPDAGEFMVQCEQCKVWQHGPCMGFESEDQLHDDDYYCERCRPDSHAELLKKLNKRGRQSSATSHHNPAPAHSRTSRSHSPSYQYKQPSKRRNTMNSRDANFDESIKAIMEATAMEAAAFDTKSVTSNGHTNGLMEGEGEGDGGASSRKKRKRSDDDSNPKKRTRSMSTTSDRPIATALVQDEAPPPPVVSKPVAPPPSTAPKSQARQRRGGGRKTVVYETPVDGEDGTAMPAVPKRQNNARAKPGNNAKRPPVSSHMPGHDRRNASGQNGAGANNADARAYRNSHAYVVSQQPLFTSWNLPDYLSHLDQMLPTETPQPLEVRASAPNGRESMERTVERGVRVKWPSKRMSVGDMNKRVRALMDWVGREQANAMDRGRRREALEKAFKELPIPSQQPNGSTSTAQATNHEYGSASGFPGDDAAASAASTMTMMEQLMEELISFQERFGPGVKSRDRDRRTISTTG